MAFKGCESESGENRGPLIDIAGFLKKASKIAERLRLAVARRS